MKFVALFVASTLSLAGTIGAFKFVADGVTVPDIYVPLPTISDMFICMTCVEVTKVNTIVSTGVSTMILTSTFSTSPRIAPHSDRVSIEATSTSTVCPICKDRGSSSSTSTAIEAAPTESTSYTCESCMTSVKTSSSIVKKVTWIRTSMAVTLSDAKSSHTKSIGTSSVTTQEYLTSVQSSTFAGSTWLPPTTSTATVSPSSTEISKAHGSGISSSTDKKTSQDHHSSRTSRHISSVESTNEGATPSTTLPSVTTESDSVSAIVSTASTRCEGCGSSISVVTSKSLEHPTTQSQKSSLLKPTSTLLVSSQLSAKPVESKKVEPETVTSTSGVRSGFPIQTKASSDSLARSTSLEVQIETSGVEETQTTTDERRVEKTVCNYCTTTGHGATATESKAAEASGTSVWTATATTTQTQSSSVSITNPSSYSALGGAARRSQAADALVAFAMVVQLIYY